VSVQFVFAGAGFAERPEEAAAGFAEGSGVDIASAHGSVDMGVVLGIADVNGKIAGVQFDVFVAGDAFDGDVTGRNTNVNAGVFGYANTDAHVVHRASGEMELRG